MFQFTSFFLRCLPLTNLTKVILCKYEEKLFKSSIENIKIYNDTFHLYCSREFIKATVLTKHKNANFGNIC